MSGWVRWWRVELPLALPIILAGVRVAAVMVIGIAAIAQQVGAGGLGTLLFMGIQLGRDDMIWAGAIMVGLLALAVNGGMLALEKVLVRTPRS
jgi:osmoprotectant transport system permease protein